MGKNTKVNVSHFISNKKIEKIENIIEKSANTDDAYDKIENLLMEDFSAKSLGTNRLILISNDKKYKDLIFKVAGDSHGIEANYREFYNGDLCEKRLTKSYSISNNGVFLVQERVTPFTSDMMKKYKKEVRAMLSHLEDKILLVDCKLSNFANFGVRKNGDIVLLDHGDTIPLTMYSNGKVVNIMEESNVSLRCKEFKKGTITSKNPKPCGGKLVYNKNYDYFICKKCGSKVDIHDAYKEFYGYARQRDGKTEGVLQFQEGFDPDEYVKQVQNSIKQYCKDTMNKANNNDNEKESKKMEKKIKGQTCQQVKGYWLPMSSKPFANVKLAAVKKGELHPAEYIKFLGLDPKDYKVHKDDHTAIDSTKGQNQYRNDNYKERSNGSNFISNKVNEILEIAKSVKPNISSRGNKYGLFRAVRIDDVFDTSTRNLEKTLITVSKQMKLRDDVSYAFADDKYIYVKFMSDSKNNYKNDYLYNESYDEPAIKEPEKQVVVEDNDVDLRGKTILTIKDVSEAEIRDVDGFDCMEYKDYYIPITIINKYFNPNYGFILPEPEKILANDGFDPDDYYIHNIQDDDDDEYDDDIDVFDDLPEAEIEEEEDEDDYEDEEEKSVYSRMIEDEKIENVIDRNNTKEITIEEIPKSVNIENNYIVNESNHSNAVSNDFYNELMNTLASQGFNEKGYAFISYANMNELVRKYGLYSLLTNGVLNDKGYNFIKSYDDIEDISDYIARKGYDIQVRGMNKNETYTDMVSSYLKGDKHNIREFAKLLDYDEFEDAVKNDDMFNALKDVLEIMIDIESSDKTSPFAIPENIYAKLRSIETGINTLINADTTDEGLELTLLKVVAESITSFVIMYAEYISDSKYSEDFKNILSEYGYPKSDINTIIKESQVERNMVNINEIIRVSMKMMDTITLNINDLKGKKFYVLIPKDDGTNLTVSLNLHDIVMKNISNMNLS